MRRRKVQKSIMRRVLGAATLLLFKFERKDVISVVVYVLINQVWKILFCFI